MKGLCARFAAKRKCWFRVKYYLPTKAEMVVVRKAAGKRKA